MLVFLGIELDTMQPISCLPMFRVKELWSRLALFKVKNKLTLLELQQQVGHLNFVCKLAASGRDFLRYFYDAKWHLCLPHHKEFGWSFSVPSFQID